MKFPFYDSLEELLERQRRIKIMQELLNNDRVNKPNHYTDTNIEVIDYIEDKGFDYHLGNAIKYISRSGRKISNGMSAIDKEIEDLEKAVWYINRKIENLKNCKPKQA